MNKSILTRALVCGILTSSFAIINCQKAPERKVTPPPVDGKVDGNKLVQCSEDVVKQLADHSAAVKAIQDKMDAAKTTPLKPEEKTALDKQFQDMVLNSNKLYTAIRALGKDSAPALGCLEVDSKIEGGSAPRLIIELQSKNKDQAKAVAILTGIPNDLASQFAKDNKYEISKSLADMLSNKLTYKGEGAISAGQILTKDDYAKLKDDKTKTSCIITSADEKPVVEKSIMVVTSLSDPKLDPATNRMKADLAVMIKAIAADTSEENTSDRAVSFNCTIADAKDTLEEVSLAFKGLAVLKLDAPKVETPQTGTASSDATSSDNTSSDQTKADNQAGEKTADGKAGDQLPAVALPAPPAAADAQSSDGTKTPDPAAVQAQVTSQVHAQEDVATKVITARAIGN